MRLVELVLEFGELLVKTASIEDDMNGESNPLVVCIARKHSKLEFA